MNFRENPCHVSVTVTLRGPQGNRLWIFDKPQVFGGAEALRYSKGRSRGETGTGLLYFKALLLYALYGSPLFGFEAKKQADG